MKKISAIIVFTVFLLFIAGFTYSKKSADDDAADEKIYTMQEVLTTDFHTPNFDFGETKLSISTIKPNFENGIQFTISKEQKEQLINEIQQLKLIEHHETFNIYDAINNDSLYMLRLTISTFYSFVFDAYTETVYMPNKKTYKIQNGDKFFAILNEIKKAPAK